MASTEFAATKDDSLRSAAPAGSADSGGIQSVGRALTILEAIAAKGGECALTELARATSLNISTCHHLLATLIKRGIKSLPCIGDGRQSGTSGSPSILNASPEAAAGGGLALLKTGDRVRIEECRPISKLKSWRVVERV